VGAPLGKAAIVGFLVVVITFVLGKAVLGNPGRLVLGPTALQEAVDQFNAALGLDRPVLVQFGDYLGDLLRGDLGESFAYTGTSVWDIVRPALGVSALLALLTVVVSAVVALVAGTAAAMTRTRGVDYAIRGVSLSALSTPAPFVSLLFILLLAVNTRVLPAGGWPERMVERGPYLVLPVAALTVGLAPILLRVVRERALVQLEEPHIEAALARGLPARRVLTRHVLPNCAGPLVIVTAMNMGTLLSGAVVVEIVFGLPGLGRVLAAAVGSSDIPVIQAVALVAGLLVTLCNVAAELVQRWIDPRLRS
jgi:peptide/nickel transport system permease protein